ncbi:helicase associated domain-containing protein [Streptomyces sp. NPDC008163]|uniref:Helicase associated domain protein n=1 Tax=Streptomyces sp. NPDC008163 TaxID=3364818 RepID=UPI0036E24EE6
MAPLQGEMTQSFLSRVAARYGVGLRDLLAAIAEVGGLSNVTGQTRVDSEVYLNRQARDRVSQLCRVPEVHLRQALPAWAQEEPRKRFTAGPAAQFHHTAEKVVPWGPACPECAARSAGRGEGARLYIKPQQRVCALHRRWLMQVPDTAGRVVRLPAGGKQWVQAQRRHARFLRRSSVAAEAFEVAAAVTASWWWQTRPREHVWPSRLRSLSSGRMDPGVWRVLARELVTYPETVALATLLADDGFRQRLIADARGHAPYRLADLPVLLSAVARCVGRPWYREQLADETSGPLFAWVYQCVRPPRRTGQGERAMWAVAPAHRLRPLVDELAARMSVRADGQKTEGKRRRGLNRQSDESFTTGLAHAGQYVREHGNLAVQKDTMAGSFRLGEWLHNVQTRAWALSPDRVQALMALDPWWNVPWSVQWQRSYYRARDHAAVDGPPDAAAGFAGTAVLNGEWLYLQCTHYDALHSEQQRLLADIGVTAEAARTARPRRASMRARFDTGLAHARAYVAEHGHLAVSGKGAVHEGYPLGVWLVAQRSKAHRAAKPTERSRALAAVDPWWNPPWPLSWQRSFAQVRRLVQDGHALDAQRGFPGLEAELALWLSHQCAVYGSLQRDQQCLLAGIGITAEEAGKVPMTAEEAKAASQAAARLGGSAGLGSARSFAAARGHLALPFDYVHEEYPLGRWLVAQRSKERRHLRATRTAWPPGRHLTELDPWWNPPWHFPWQRNYQQARTLWQEDRLLLPGQHAPPGDRDEDEDPLTVWLRRQCARHDVLHPEQQNLLADIGITAATARTVTASLTTATPGEIGLAHARSYAAEHGNLAVTDRTRHNGHPLGSWLLRQRQRAADGRIEPARLAALNALDPHWNPSWPLAWQRAYHRARAATDGGTLTSSERRWIRTQAQLWDSLNPAQQQLLAHLGTTGPTAVPPPARTAARHYPPGEGLPHARAYATLHGHLAVSVHTHQDGFPLGRWLVQQRRKARSGQLSASTLQELTVLDPWWNPPWSFTWQRKYHQYRTTRAAERPIPPELHHWARRQATLWEQLHPHQQGLLTGIGLHPAPIPLGAV